MTGHAFGATVFMEWRGWKGEMVSGLCVGRTVGWWWRGEEQKKVTGNGVGSEILLSVKE